MSGRNTHLKSNEKKSVSLKTEVTLIALFQKPILFQMNLGIQHLVGVLLNAELRFTFN